MCDETNKKSTQPTAEELMEAIKKQKPVIIDGICLPTQMPGITTWEEKIPQLRQMTLRDDDVWLLTYPKAGTHWLWEMLGMVRKGRAEHDTVTKVQTMVEFVDIQVLHNLPSPRTLDTHLPFSMLPVPEMKARRLKSVHVYRNPKDSCVSMYHMAMSSKMMTAHMGISNFDDFFDKFFHSDEFLYGNYFKYLRQMRDFQRENPEIPFLNLSYENVKKDPVGSVKQLSRFLGVAVSDELCVQIAEECSFDRMKKQEASKAVVRFTAEEPSQELKSLMSKGDIPVIYRKGQIGDWKNYFTVAMNERADDIIKTEMRDLPYTMTYE